MSLSIEKAFEILQGHIVTELRVAEDELSEAQARHTAAEKRAYTLGRLDAVAEDLKRRTSKDFKPSPKCGGAYDITNVLYKTELEND